MLSSTVALAEKLIPESPEDLLGNGYGLLTQVLVSDDATSEGSATFFTVGNTLVWKYSALSSGEGDLGMEGSASPATGGSAGNRSAAAADSAGTVPWWVLVGLAAVVPGWMLGARTSTRKDSRRSLLSVRVFRGLSAMCWGLLKWLSAMCWRLLKMCGLVKWMSESGLRYEVRSYRSQLRSENFDWRALGLHWKGYDAGLSWVFSVLDESVLAESRMSISRNEDGSEKYSFDSDEADRDHRDWRAKYGRATLDYIMMRDSYKNDHHGDHHERLHSMMNSEWWHAPWDCWPSDMRSDIRLLGEELCKALERAPIARSIWNEGRLSLDETRAYLSDWTNKRSNEWKWKEYSEMVRSLTIRHSNTR